MRESVRTAATTALISKAAKLIGRFLAKKPAAQVRRLLAQPLELLGLKISMEDAAIFGANAVGLTVNEAILKLFPQLAASTRTWINIAISMIAMEYVNAVRSSRPLAEDAVVSPLSHKKSEPADEPQDKRERGATRFTELLAQAMHSQSVLLSDAAWRLFGIITGAQLTRPQYDDLEHCDSPAKFVLLSSCDDYEQFCRILPTMTTSQDRGPVESTLRGLRSLGAEAGDAIRRVRERSRKKAAELDQQREALERQPNKAKGRD